MARTTKRRENKNGSNNESKDETKTNIQDMPYKIIIIEPEAIKDDSSTLTQITKKQQGVNKLQIPTPKKKQSKKRKRKTKKEIHQTKQEKCERYPSQMRRKT